jgi:hypothetical protein
MADPTGPLGVVEGADTPTELNLIGAGGLEQLGSGITVDDGDAGAGVAIRAGGIGLSISHDLVLRRRSEHGYPF